MRMSTTDFQSLIGPTFAKCSAFTLKKKIECFCYREIENVATLSGNGVTLFVTLSEYRMY